jgi:AAT family amino acid transporter
MNTVILLSVLSAGNHTLFAGTRVLYGLSVTTPVAQAPRIFSWTTTNCVPLPTLLATSSVGAVSFGVENCGAGCRIFGLASWSLGELGLDGGDR